MEFAAKDGGSLSRDLNRLYDQIAGFLSSDRLWQSVATFVAAIRIDAYTQTTVPPKETHNSRMEHVVEASVVLGIWPRIHQVILGKEFSPRSQLILTCSSPSRLFPELYLSIDARHHPLVRVADETEWIRKSPHIRSRFLRNGGTTGGHSGQVGMGGKCAGRCLGSTLVWICRILGC